MEKCKRCHRTYHTRAQLLEHLRTNHGFTLTIRCNKCDYETADRGKLSRHFGCKHPKARDDHQFLAFDLASEVFLKDTRKRREASTSKRANTEKVEGESPKKKAKDEVRNKEKKERTNSKENEKKKEKMNEKDKQGNKDEKREQIEENKDEQRNKEENEKEEHRDEEEKTEMRNEEDIETISITAGDIEEGDRRIVMEREIEIEEEPVEAEEEEERVMDEKKEEEERVIHEKKEDNEDIVVLNICKPVDGEERKVKVVIKAEYFRNGNLVRKVVETKFL